MREIRKTNSTDHKKVQLTKQTVTKSEKESLRLHYWLEMAVFLCPVFLCPFSNSLHNSAICVIGDVTNAPSLAAISALHIRCKGEGNLEFG